MKTTELKEMIEETTNIKVARVETGTKYYEFFNSNEEKVATYNVTTGQLFVSSWYAYH